MRLTYQWHGRLGRLLAPLLAVSALSGAVLLWMQPLPTPDESPRMLPSWSTAVDQGLATLAQRHPGAAVEYVNLPRRPGDTLRVHLLASPTTGSGWADIDPTTGAAGPLEPDSSSPRMLLYGLHEHLLLADAGPWVLRSVALCAFIAVLMGLRIWWRARRVPARTPWRRFHRVVGPVVVLPLAMMLATGFLLRWPELARAVFATAPAPAPAAKAAAPQPAAPPTGSRPAATLGEALASATAALPQARPIRLYPARAGAIRVRMRGDEWHPLGLTNVFIGTADGQVQRVVHAAQQPMTLRYLNLVYPLHTAWLPGTPGVAAALGARALWTLLALSLAGLALSGAVQQFRKQ